MSDIPYVPGVCLNCNGHGGQHEPWCIYGGGETPPGGGGGETPPGGGGETPPGGGGGESSGKDSAWVLKQLELEKKRKEQEQERQQLLRYTVRGGSLVTSMIRSLFSHQPKTSSNTKKYLHEIDKRHLQPGMRGVAIALKEKYPFVEFSSGKRDIYTQADAMAENIVIDRNYIQKTYMKDANEVLLKKCHRQLKDWVDKHPEAQTKKEIEDGLLSVIKSMKKSEQLEISDHLKGDAFDIKPIPQTENPEAVKDFIKSLPGHPTVKTDESGKPHWHIQFP